ncbi:MAG: TetR/AcrR family transcriptional regulator [Actinomycetota bacterium]|nr:TetR/AcrR family transcriptional regulator [Actinomycetota bacterium]
MTPPAVPQNARQALLDAAKRIMAHTGFRAVGLNEVLSQAGVPKGSFYHYFSSKDAFGEAIMQDYFVSYLANMDGIFADPAAPAAERLLRYFEEFRARQSADDFQSGCLVVTLGPEAANLTGPMRGELNSGVSQIIDRLEHLITAGVADKSMSSADPRSSAETLYEMWVGASIMAKINRNPATFDTTMTATRQHLKMASAVGRQPV